MIKNRVLLVAALVLLAVSSVYPIPRATLRSAHAASVTASAVTGEENLLVTAGADGKMIVWDTETDRLLRSIRIDRLPIDALAPYPDGSRIAVYSTNGAGIDRISVWDWRSGERVFLHQTTSEVLSLSVSPGGRYLTYTVPGLESLVILDARSGAQIRSRAGATGLISWHVVGTSERRVVTYTPTDGSLVYREIGSGEIAGSFQAPEQLDLLTILPSRRHAVASAPGDRLTVIDLLSGAVTDSRSVGDVIGIYQTPETEEILVHSRSSAGRHSIRRFGVQDGELELRFAQPRTIPDSVTVVRPVNRELFAGTEDGSILRWPAFESVASVMAENLIEPVSDIYFAEDRLHLLTADRVISISSDFFNHESGDRIETSFVRDRVAEINAGPESRFIADADEDLLVWMPRDLEAAVHEFRLYSSQTDPVLLPYPTSIQAVDAHDNRILLVSRAGRVQLFDRISNEELFSYPGIGIQTAIATSRGVFVGKTDQGPIDSALLRLNPETGETVPLTTAADLVFYLYYDERRGRLYSIGLQRDSREVPRTIIEVIEGASFDRRRSIIEVTGEYLSAQVAVDSTTGLTYTNLDDRGGIVRWERARPAALIRNPAHVPERMIVAGDYLFSANADGTVSVVDRYAGTAVMDFYVLRNTRGDWIAMQQDGGYAASSARQVNERTISVNDDRWSLESLRLFIAGEIEVDVEQGERDSGDGVDPRAGDQRPSS